MNGASRHLLGVLAMTATILPNAKSQFIDSNGKPLAGGTVYFYIPNTSTPKATWQDPAQTILNTQPIVLDASGQALIWGSGVYRQVVFDQFNNLIWDQITEDANAGLTGNLVDDIFVAGTDFVPGTTTQLTLTAGAGTIANTWIFFDGTYQADSTITSLNGTTLTFNSPIPVGVTTVTVKIGMTVAVGIPANGSVTDATVATGANIDSSKLSFLQAGAAAVRRTVQSKLRDVVSVKDFGAKGDGSTDDTASMQAAHATGKTIYYPAGTYKFSTLTLAQGGIIGDGKGQTILSSSDLTSADVITYTGTGFSAAIPLFRDFTLQSSLSKTAGAGIRFLPGSGELSYATIDNVMFNALPTGIYFSAASQFKVDKCDFVNYSAQGIHVENTNENDSGDSFISNCFLNTSVPTGSTFGIWYRTSGGLKVTNCKILGGNSGFVMGFNGTQNVADLLIDNCSIEDTTAFGIFLGRDSGTFGFGTVQINNCEIGCPTCIGTDTSGFLTLLTIDGNTLNIASTSGVGISLNNVSNINVGPNVINGQFGGNPIGISVTSSCSNGKIAPQCFIGIPAANRLSNASATVSYIEASQTGTVGSVTTSTGYSSLFTATVAVTFARPFSVAPTDVSINVPPVNGGLCGNAVNITTTGFTAQIFGVTNGGNVSGATYSTEGGVI